MYGTIDIYDTIHNRALYHYTYELYRIRIL